jgi:hypothetical protein
VGDEGAGRLAKALTDGVASKIKSGERRVVLQCCHQLVS